MVLELFEELNKGSSRIPALREALKDYYNLRINILNVIEDNGSAAPLDEFYEGFFDEYQGVRSHDFLRDRLQRLNSRIRGFEKTLLSLGSTLPDDPAESKKKKTKKKPPSAALSEKRKLRPVSGLQAATSAANELNIGTTKPPEVKQEADTVKPKPTVAEDKPKRASVLRPERPEKTTLQRKKQRSKKRKTTDRSGQATVGAFINHLKDRFQEAAEEQFILKLQTMIKGEIEIPPTAMEALTIRVSAVLEMLEQHRDLDISYLDDQDIIANLETAFSQGRPVQSYDASVSKGYDELKESFLLTLEPTLA